MNDELITRLRAADAWNDLEMHMDSLCAEAADALEAAQRRVAWLENQVQLGLEEMADLLEERRTLRAERDAEVALADQLAEAVRDLNSTGSYTNVNVRKERETAVFTALAAHRERRTTPTKPADDKTRWYGAPTKDGDQ